MFYRSGNQHPENQDNNIVFDYSVTDNSQVIAYGRPSIATANTEVALQPRGLRL